MHHDQNNLEFGFYLSNLVNWFQVPLSLMSDSVDIPHVITVAIIVTLLGKLFRVGNIMCFVVQHITLTQKTKECSHIS